MLSTTHAQAAADQPEAADQPATTPHHYEVWSGADTGSSYWMLYGGATLAPFGDMHATGFKARLVAGYGRYGYQAFDDTIGDRRNYRAETGFTDVLVGYLWRLDPLILKLFVGASLIEHRIYPTDEDNSLQGAELGVKGVAEAWFNLPHNAYASVDLAWSNAHRTRSARARLGARMTPQFSIGPEAGINMDRQGDDKIAEEALESRQKPTDYVRLGGFARYEWHGGEISASAGFIGDFRENGSGYATLNWTGQF